MNGKQDYLFWKLINLFVKKYQYRIVKISENQQEVWLESLEKKSGQIIRLLRHDLDWSIWLQRDMENTIYNIEQIRKKLRKKKIHALNIYVSTFPPVDDWKFRTEKPLLEGQQSILDTIVIESTQIHEGLSNLSHILNIKVPNDENVEEESVEQLKQNTFVASAERSKNDHQLFNQGKPRITYLLIAIQVIMFFILEMMGGSTNTLTLLKMGAKYNPLIIKGEWWRFFTPIFLHIGFLHLAMNTLALYYLGIAVEKIFGNIRFLVIYLFAGFMGSVASFVFSSSLSAGASGAIFGCFGALLYFGVIHPNLFARTMGSSIIAMIGINLVFGFVVSGIDNAGHIGGLLGGFLAAGIVHLPKQKMKVKQLLFLLMSTVIATTLLLYGFHYPKKENPKLLVGLAQEYIQQKQYGQVELLLEDVKANKETGAEINFFLSYAELQLGEVDKAQAHLEQAIKQNPKFHQAYYNLALVYLDQHQYALAKESIGKAVKIEPKDKKYKALLKNINQQLKGSE